VEDPEVRYAERDGIHLGFTVFGEGPVHVATTHGRFRIDLMWALPAARQLHECAGAGARVIAWDQRGWGASELLLDPTAATSEALADDTVRARTPVK
jgi:pimeloyl-ACP methyl ester carboxylesterase